MQGNNRLCPQRMESIRHAIIIHEFNLVSSSVVSHDHGPNFARRQTVFWQIDLQCDRIVELDRHLDFPLKEERSR